jgi:hypothetical protein
MRHLIFETLWFSIIYGFNDYSGSYVDDTACGNFNTTSLYTCANATDAEIGSCAPLCSDFVAINDSYNGDQNVCDRVALLGTNCISAL